MKRRMKSVTAINALVGLVATTSLIALAPTAHAATSAPGKSCAPSALGVQASYKDAKEGQQTLTCGRITDCP